MDIQVLRNPLSKSLLAHLALLLMAIWFVFIVPPARLNDEPISLEIVEPTAPAMKDLQKTKTVVQPTAGQEVERARDDSYLSDKNRAVKEETTAKSTNETRDAKTNNKEMVMVPKPKNTDSTKPIKLSDLGVKIAQPKKDESFENQRHWAEVQTGEAMRGGEYVQGVKEGDVSALNTKEFVFYSYFARIRNQLDQTWKPLLREQIGKVHRKGRHLAANNDYITRTVVTLDAKGEVTRVQLLEESGTTDLDKAALDALNKAGPYPNPPRGLVDGAGQVQIRWDFILKT